MSRLAELDGLLHQKHIGGEPLVLGRSQDADEALVEILEQAEKRYPLTRRLPELPPPFVALLQPSAGTDDSGLPRIRVLHLLHCPAELSDQQIGAVLETLQGFRDGFGNRSLACFPVVHDPSL